ncbi:hypothetical protein D8M21_10845 [Kocuria sp. HSID16901]|nr:hypothetical protein D8M21_10845 [Kocuria sp. HSID16901]
MDSDEPREGAYIAGVEPTQLVSSVDWLYSTETMWSLLHHGINGLNVFLFDVVFRLELLIE